MPDSAASAVTVQLVYLARLREAFGRAAEPLVIPANHEATVGSILERLRARGGAWANELAMGRAGRVAVNHDMATSSTFVRDGDEVALFPPVTGG